MKIIRLLVTTVIIWQCLDQKAIAQTPVDSLYPFSEMVKISAALYTADHISFNVNYYYQQKDSSSYSNDSLSGQYKINGENFYAKLDSTEIVQNTNYNVSVSHNAKTIVINKPQVISAGIFQLDLFDTLFNRMYVSDIQILDTGSMRKLNILFKEFSPYSHYEVGYNPSTRMISWVSYRVRKGIPSSSALIAMPVMYSPDDYIDIRVKFTNLQLQSFTDSVFDITSYVVQSNGVFAPSATYAGYDIFDQSDK